ncbi:MAG: putative zinc-binding protein [Limisphaerales bacterium]
MNIEIPNPRNVKKPATVVYACSGCSDAGEIADRVARQFTRDGAAQMSCLAGIGGRVKSLVSKAEKAERILVIDGCPLNCAARTLKLAGFQRFDHLELHKIGIRKGSCPVTDERIASGVEASNRILAGETASTSAAIGSSPQQQDHKAHPLDAGIINSYAHHENKQPVESRSQA